MLLPLAAIVAVGGGVVWNRVVADDDDVILIEAGEYVDPASTNPEHDGESLPAFELVDVEGRPAVLEPGGRPMVVNLWYSSCPPCSRELTAFGQVHDEVGDDVRFVGVNPLDEADRMVRYAADRGADYELLMDPDNVVADELRILQYPVTLFVGADGEIVAQTGELSEAELRAHVDELLA